MSRRNSRTQNRRNAVEDKMLERCKRRLKPLREDDYDDENPAMQLIKPLSKLTRKQRESIKAQRGRSVMYMPDSDDDGGWVPEQGTTSDEGFYKKWFKDNKKEE